MVGLMFRNDDVTFNTDLSMLQDCYSVIRSFYGAAAIWSCVTLFCEHNRSGSVYRDVPFKNKKSSWFYSADKFIDKISDIPGTNLASHGLYHVDHSAIGYDAQEMSILGSCRFLRTSLFVPPFNRYNEDTIKICADNGIYLAKQGEWKSLEHDQFFNGWHRWYFHSWRFGPNKIKEALLNDFSFKK